MDTHGEVAGLLLAAGGGQRLGGRPKALLRYRGRPLVEHAVEVLRVGGCARVHVVLGASARRVRESADLSGCVVVDNPRWEEGLASSLRAGLASLAGTGRGTGTDGIGETDGDAYPGAGPPRTDTAGPVAAVVGLVDQPRVPAAAVARVIAAARAGDDLPSALVAAVYAGRRGHPVLFGAGRWAGVGAGADADRGARDYLREHAGQTLLVECGDIGDPADIDTPADLALLDEPAPGTAPGR